ncbi:FecCD family ABC transporter permease [Ideonella sp.]|uniref:FecCD family ABC transporter permease n=1 Tax=Ideonella sp. TaxID=1929293 RepID=UPI0035B45749
MNTLAAWHRAFRGAGRPPRDGGAGSALRPALAAAALLGVLLAGAVQFGAVPVSAADWLAPWRPGTDPASAGGAHVLWQLRLPRALLALAVGACLALAGALAQGLFRNPLADPGLLGITSGAACAAALVLTVFSGATHPLPAAWRPWVLPASALAGGLTVCLALDRLARWLTPGSVAGLLLTGLALNAGAMAVVGLCTYLATDEQLRSLSFWTLGSLAGGEWAVVGVLAAVLALTLPLARRLADGLNALALGEAVAGHVGLDVARLRTRVVVAVALLCGLAVAWCGVIGFIGLMAPHLARLVAGADHRRVLPLSAAFGAALLLVADTVARTVALPAEIPVGIFTALLGAPLFLALLRQASRGGAA